MTTVTPKPLEGQRNMQPHKGQARFAFIVLLIINILNYADRYVLPAILKKIQASPAQGGLGITNFQAGLIGSSFLIVYAISTLPIGMWADKGVRKNIVAICVGLWSVATVLAAITSNFIQLFSVRAILGIGEAGYAPASISLLGDFFPKEQRGRILSYWSSGTLIGSAIGFALGGLVADAFGWRWAFVLVGIPGLISAFLAWRVSEPRRGALETTEQESSALEATQAHISNLRDFWETTKKLLRIPTYWVLLGALTFSFFTIGGTSFWLPSYFADDFHLSVGTAGTISGVVLVVGGLLGTILGGWLADAAQKRRPEGRMIVSTLGFIIGAPLVLIALLIHNLALFIGVFILAAMFLSFCTGPIQAIIQDVVKPTMRATAVGFSLLFAHVFGDVSSPTLIGFISDISNHNLGFALLITAPTALFIAGLICLIGLKTVDRDMQKMEEQLHIPQK